MRTHKTTHLSRQWSAAILIAAAAAIGLSVGTVAQSPDPTAHIFPNPHERFIARGGGTTIIEGGTGSPLFTPVTTTIAFYAERRGGVVTGHFECLALAPASPEGDGSGQFTQNAMYVTGAITGAQVQRDTATLTGTATITGLGAGSNVPFTVVVRRGGPGSPVVLTTGDLTFPEILVEGSFEVSR